jgi:dUTP pyrophosphatase
MSDNIEELLNRLKEMEQTINDDENDMSFINELNNIITLLNPKNDVVSVLNVNIKKLHKDSVIPSYSKEGDAGMDLTITRIIENTTFSVSYGFGIAMEIPKNYVGLIFPRSSVRNKDLILSNCVGVIDSGYRGEIQATFKKTNGLDSMKYDVGDRGAQIIIIPYPQVKFNEVQELSETDRGIGGFGSTGL